MAKTYFLWATINRIHDGDTAYADIDHGLGLWNKGINDGGWGLRLANCNARELGAPGGIEARAFLRSLIPEGTVIEIESVSWDKYAGRLDVLIDHPLYGDLSTYLIDQGWAAAWNGKGAAPVPPWPRTV